MEFLYFGLPEPLDLVVEELQRLEQQLWEQLLLELEDVQLEQELELVGEELLLLEQEQELVLVGEEQLPWELL